MPYFFTLLPNILRKRSVKLYVLCRAPLQDPLPPKNINESAPYFSFMVLNPLATQSSASSQETALKLFEPFEPVWIMGFNNLSGLYAACIAWNPLLQPCI